MSKYHSYLLAKLELPSYLAFLEPYGHFENIGTT